MRAAVYKGVGIITIEDIPVPEIGDEDVLVKVMACAVCGTDLRIYRSGHRKVKPPHVIGHEVGGIIEKVGKNVTDYLQGQRVVLVTEVGCTSCRWCRQDRKNLCPEMKAFGYFYPGGFAEFLKVPAEAVQQGNLLSLPESLSFEQGALIEPLSCCINGQEYLNIGEGDTVVIIGAGPIGLMHGALAKAKGAGRLIVIDISCERLRMAEGFSVDLLIDSSKEDAVEKVMEATNNEGADVIITACPAGKAQEDALLMAGVRSRISFFGGLPSDKSNITIDSNVIHYREIAIFGASSSSTQHYIKALDMVKDGSIDLAKFITATLPLEKIEEGLHTISQGKAIKVIIQP